MSNIVRRNFPVQGMGCAACVARVQNTIKSLDGVSGCNVSLASNSAQVDYDPKVVTSAEIRKAVQDAGYDLVIVNEDDPEEDADSEADRLREDYYRGLKRDAVTAIALSLLLMLIGMGFRDFSFKGYVLWALATPALFWCGRRFLFTVLKQARHFSSGMDTLVSLSTLISYFLVFSTCSFRRSGLPEGWSRIFILGHPR